MSPLCSGLFLMVLSNYVSLRSYWCMTPTGCQLLHKRKVAILHKHTFVHTYTLVQENCTKPHSSFAHFKFLIIYTGVPVRVFPSVLKTVFLAAQKVQDTLCNFFCFHNEQKDFQWVLSGSFSFPSSITLEICAAYGLTSPC